MLVVFDIFVSFTGCILEDINEQRIIRSKEKYYECKVYF